jgi:hypothetical protein
MIITLILLYLLSAIGSLLGLNILKEEGMLYKYESLAFWSFIPFSNTVLALGLYWYYSHERRK